MWLLLGVLTVVSVVLFTVALVQLLQGRNVWEDYRG